MTEVTCWDDPERCKGCHYCQQKRDTGVWGNLSPEEAHLKDLEDAAMRRSMDADRRHRAFTTRTTFEKER